MLTHRTRLLARRFMLCCLPIFGAVQINCPHSLAEEPSIGAMLSETPLVALLPWGEPLTVMPRVSIDEAWPLGEFPPGTRQGSAGVPALLAPLGDEESATVLMPPVPDWSRQAATCPAMPHEETSRFGFLNGRQAWRATWLVPPEEDPGTPASQFSDGDRSLPGTVAFNAPGSPVVLPPTVALEPLTIGSMRRRPVAPSGTMYLWSTTSEAYAPQGHSGASTSAGVVLTRPPGAYSIDWVGIAVTAPIQWR